MTVIAYSKKKKKKIFSVALGTHSLSNENQIIVYDMSVQYNLHSKTNSTYYTILFIIIQCIMREISFDRITIHNTFYVTINNRSMTNT